jgi:N-acetylmuramoyl-L-alanine amidase-like protein
MALVKPSWMPVCKMHRIILHWTAGAYVASALDKEHYHILIQGDGTLVRGDHTIDDNVNTGDDDYAAHTRGRNTGSIGVSVCCMAGAVERPFKGGSFPMKKNQWLTMAAVTAELAMFYKIKVTPKTILGHGEVQKNIGPPQRGKWDPMVLPWDPSLSKAKVGDMFRAEVEKLMV